MGKALKDNNYSSPHLNPSHTPTHTQTTHPKQDLKDIIVQAPDPILIPAASLPPIIGPPQIGKQMLQRSNKTFLQNYLMSAKKAIF